MGIDTIFIFHFLVVTIIVFILAYRSFCVLIRAFVCKRPRPWHMFPWKLMWNLKTEKVPSGYLTVCHGKSPFLIGKPSISMGHLYHGYVK